MIEPRKVLSVVVPIFNEEKVINAFYERLKRALESITSLDHEIIFIDDGSCDQSYSLLCKIAARDAKLKIIKFSRNFGHQIAITAGIDIALGDSVVVIDADLQDPPEIIPLLVDKWLEGYDVVFCMRTERQGETWFKLFSARLFYRVIRMLSKIDIPPAVGDFRLISRRVVQQLNGIRERDRYVRGLVSWIGFKQIGISYTRDCRYAGNTKYTYKKMLKFALDGITSFSNVPLKLATWLGYIASCGAFLYLGSVFVQKLLGITVQGWATIQMSVLFLGGVQLICVGILGEYVGRIFNEVKQRPLYVIQEICDYSVSSDPGDQGTNTICHLPIDD